VTTSTVVIVSPYFPPSTLAGVHRARHLAKHLPAVGWTPIVLCVDETDHEQILDPALASLVPNTVDVVKVCAINARWSRPIGVGDISIRAWFRLRAALFRLIETRNVAAVLITGSPFYPMLFAPSIKRKYGVPVILDFQDPWVSTWGASQPPLSKSGLAHRLAVALEPYALRAADFVTSVSETQNVEMARRYQWLDKSRMAAIPIGGDPDDFASISATTSRECADDLDPRFINLSYVGTFLPRSASLIKVLFRAFARLRLVQPALGARIRLNFIGTSNQPVESAPMRVLPIALAEGVGDAVHEISQRLPYLRALSIVAKSDGLLLIGSDEPHYTASKIYPALLSGRPFLSLFHSASSAHRTLAAAGGGYAFAFTTLGELEALEVPLSEGLRALANSPETMGRADPTSYAPFRAADIARRFSEVFDSLLARAYRGT
jgi:hypothetical protein